MSTSELKESFPIFDIQTWLIKKHISCSVNNLLLINGVLAVTVSSTSESQVLVEHVLPGGNAPGSGFQCWLAAF